MKKEDILHLMQGMGIARNCIKPSDEWIACPCPFSKWTHAKGKDRSASFGISIADGGRSGFNCLSCKEHGNIVGLLERLGDLDGKDYSELISEVEDLELTTTFAPWDEKRVLVKPLPDPMDEDEFDELFEPASQVRAARDYFKRRGLLLSSLDTLDLRWDAYRNRILFKVKREGLLYGMSGRSVLENAKQKVKVYHHPKSLFLLGEEYIMDDTSRPTVVIEGLMGLPELDSCNLFDYANCVALQGSDMSIEQRDRLVDLGNPVILLLDKDKAGKEGTYGKRLADGSYKEGALRMLQGLIEVSVADWPEDIDDLSELSESETYQMIAETLSFRY